MQYKSKEYSSNSKIEKLQVFQLRALQDNYIYILRDEDKDQTAVVDPSLAEPVDIFLEEKKWNLDFILNTHHHYDHVGGNVQLQKKWKCQILGFSQDAHRIPGISQALKVGDEFLFGQHKSQILFLPGHTLGHIAYWFLEEKKLFCGDTLFAMGCGRIFEGTYEQMFDSLQQLKALPAETKIYCAHEYTEKNACFALTIDPDNKDLQKRMRDVQRQTKKREPTIPFFLSEDLKTNPFLRASNVQAFASLRRKKDSF